jgi:hypothetical protein
VRQVAELAAGAVSVGQILRYLAPVYQVQRLGRHVLSQTVFVNDEEQVVSLLHLPVLFLHTQSALEQKIGEHIAGLEMGVGLELLAEFGKIQSEDTVSMGLREGADKCVETAQVGF